MKKQLISSLKQSLSRDTSPPPSYKPTKQPPSNYSSFTNTQIDYSKSHQPVRTSQVQQYYNLDSDEEAEEQDDRQLMNSTEQLDEDMMQEIQQEIMRDEEQKKTNTGNNTSTYSTAKKTIVQERHQLPKRTTYRSNTKINYFQDSPEQKHYRNTSTQYIQQEETKIDNTVTNRSDGWGNDKKTYISVNSTNIKGNNQNSISASMNKASIGNSDNGNKIIPTTNKPTVVNKGNIPAPKRPFYPNSQSQQQPYNVYKSPTAPTSPTSPTTPPPKRTTSTFPQQSPPSQSPNKPQLQWPNTAPTPLPYKKLNQSTSPSPSPATTINFSINIKLLKSNLPVRQLLKCIAQNTNKDEAVYVVSLNDQHNESSTTTVSNQEMTYFYKDALLNYYQELHFSNDSQEETQSRGESAN